MKTIFLLLLLASCIHAQSFQLSVINGYGSGLYNVGDTVHIWGIECGNDKSFSGWTGDISHLFTPDEFHSKLIMPAKDIIVTGQVKTLPNYQVAADIIKGRDTLKKVLHYFPQDCRGVVYIFHGTSGSASAWMLRTGNRDFVNAVIATDTLGFIITEAEEITRGRDLNGDGNLRWFVLPIDSVNNVDYANIKAITDTLIYRGKFNRATPRYSMGMSNGGSFSAGVSHLFNYRAGVSYCASSNPLIFTNRNTPFAFRMALYDDHEEVGPVGNYHAFQNDSILASRGICHDYVLYDRQPLYPERFARIEGITTSMSISIFNELKSNGRLDQKNFAIEFDSIVSHIQANPTLYPVLLSQPSNVKLILTEIRTSSALHEFFPDLNARTLKFFSDPCFTMGTTGVGKDDNSANVNPHPGRFHLDQNYPNPFNPETTIRFTLLESSDVRLRIISVTGETVRTDDLGYLSPGVHQFNVNLTGLSSGMWIYEITTDRISQYGKMMILK